jgi:hypothetical protein
MSRFWAAQDSSSDSGSDSSDDSSVSDSSVEEQRKTADRWLDISDSDGTCCDLRFTFYVLQCSAAQLVTSSD